MKIISIVGARPQFIKTAAIDRAFKKFMKITHIIIHTGQHYDENMSSIFFKEMEIPKPEINLGINAVSPGRMIGRMIENLEPVLIREKPDCVIVYGDTNTTLAGAVSSVKANFRLSHIESGMRSHNMKMPEEINRVLTDRISNYLFCSTERAVKNLENEGFGNFDCKIIKCGDVMLDAALYYEKKLRKLNINTATKFKDYALCTVHRAENTDDIDVLKSILKGLEMVNNDIPVMLPLHPRTRIIIENNNIKSSLNFIDPVGYLQMIDLIKNSRVVLTDSGGLQKEAFFFKKPCVTLRTETEWEELVRFGFNKVAGVDSKSIYNCFKQMSESNQEFDINLYGEGNASDKIIQELYNFTCQNE